MRILSISCVIFISLLVCVCAASGTSTYTQVPPSCVKKTTNVRPHIISPLPHEYLAPEDVPAAWDWRNVNGKNYATVSRNQHLPQYCGSCWAFASSSALGDRLRIANDAQFPEYELAPQVLVNCVNDSTCHGGHTADAYEYMRVSGIPDETCAPYAAVDQECTAANICRNCDYDLDSPTAKCTAQKTYPLYYVSEHGSVKGEDNIKAEIFARGPIACTVAVTQDLINYNGGIFNDATGTLDLDHEISVVGWGVENNTPYWIIRNSWGTYWGEKGWLRLVRGTNNLGVESACYWGVPKI